MIDLEELKLQMESALSEGQEEGSRWALNVDPQVILGLINQVESASTDAQRYQWMIEHGAPEDWQAVGNQDKQFRSTYVDTFIRKGESHD